jgi:hypothetical protein
MINKKVIFFHIPKCGGTTIEFALENFFGVGSVKYPATVYDYLMTVPTDINLFKVLAGHITHDVALPYMNNSILIALFRNPAKRIRSLYNYYYFLNDESLDNKLARSQLFRDWIECRTPNILVQIQNSVIRQFTPESYWMVDRAACPELIMNYAKTFIDKFDLIGDLDDYNNFLTKLTDLLGVNIPFEYKLNSSSEDMTQSVSDAELQDWLIENSRLDLEFYEYIRTKS